MFTDPNYVKALLDAKMQEVNQLADYFEAKDKATISCLNRLNKMFIEDKLDATQYSSLLLGYNNSKRELLYGKTAGGVVLYIKASEAIAMCEIIVELMLP